MKNKWANSMYGRRKKSQSKGEREREGGKKASTARVLHEYRLPAEQGLEGPEELMQYNVASFIITEDIARAVRTLAQVKDSV